MIRLAEQSFLLQATNLPVSYASAGGEAGPALRKGGGRMSDSQSRSCYTDVSFLSSSWREGAGARRNNARAPNCLPAAATTPAPPTLSFPTNEKRGVGGAESCGRGCAGRAFAIATRAGQGPLQLPVQLGEWGSVRETFGLSPPGLVVQWVRPPPPAMAAGEGSDEEARVLQTLRLKICE